MRKIDARPLFPLIVAATVIGAGLRLATAPHFDFYGDELWTLKWSQASAGEIFGYFGGGLTMHLYIFLIKAWTAVVGLSPLMVKLPSLIAGTALIPLVYWIGRSWLDAHSAALAAVMVALNAQMIVHSRTARVYAILAVAVLFSMFLFVRALRSGSRRDLLFGALLNASLLALSLNSIYVLIVQGAVLVLETLSRRLPLRRLASFAGGYALSLGLGILFYHRAFAGLGKVAGDVGVAEPKELTIVPWLPAQKLWIPFSANHRIVPWLMLAILGVGSWVAWRRLRLTGRLLVLWALLPPIIYFLQRSQLPGDSIARYLLPAVPAQLLLIALGGLLILRRLIPASKSKWALGLAMLLIAAATFSDRWYRRQLVTQQEPTEQAIRRILETAESGDLVTSFPGYYHEFFQLHVGDAAVKLSALQRNSALPRSGRIIILTRALRQTPRWWRQYFEIEEIGGPRYRRRFHLLTSRKMPAGPDALRGPLEQFYLGFLDAVASGTKLNSSQRIHYSLLSRIHDRLADLAEAAGMDEETREHRLLERNPRAWAGDMASYPALMARLRDGPLPRR